LRQWGGKLSFSKLLWLTFRENPGSVGEDLKVQPPGNFMFFTSSLNKSETVRAILLTWSALMII
jgi:hypothetical protein